MSATFIHQDCGKPARWVDDELSHETTDDALACRFECLNPEQAQRLRETDPVECTCGLTFPSYSAFTGHQDQVIEDQGTVSGHWEAGTV